MGTNRTVMGILLSLMLLLGTQAQATYRLTTTRACSGAGFEGSAEYLNNYVEFQACSTPFGYHAFIRNEAGQVKLELMYYTATEQVLYMIDGIAISATEELAPTQKSAIRRVMQSKEILSVAVPLYAELQKMGFSKTSDGMAALAGLITGIQPEGIYESAGNQSLCEGCYSATANCAGCCGPGCFCAFCTEDCLEHDDCFDGTSDGYSLECNIQFLGAVVSVFRAILTGDACQGLGPDTDGEGFEDTCSDPQGCCPLGYHECCDWDLCCHDEHPPDSCP